MLAKKQQSIIQKKLEKRYSEYVKGLEEKQKQMKEIKTKQNEDFPKKFSSTFNMKSSRELLSFRPSREETQIPIFESVYRSQPSLQPLPNTQRLFRMPHNFSKPIVPLSY